MSAEAAARDPAALFEAQRPRLFGLAYRMLGSVGDAEDAVQDAFLRWQGSRDVASPPAYLTTTVTRLCIDRVRHLAVERAHYSGPWLPEPLLADAPDVDAERDETMSLALLRMLERLPAHERAVFVLREALDLEYADIAAAVGAPVATCRQWYRRARTHLAGERRFDLAPDAQLTMLPRLQAALEGGDIRALVELLDPQIEMRGDGGGKVQALISVVTGVERVATVLLHIARKLPRRARLVTINGGIGIASFDGDRLDAISTFEVAGGRLLYFDSVRNPDKLQRIALGLRGAQSPIDDWR